MIFRKGFLFYFVLLCQFICAQNDSITQLDPVEVSDRQLQHFSSTQSVQKLNDSVIRQNRPSLTALLNYNSTIYFKENGPGMVSSPSFRGTTAQQTAVVWNGININSQFNGQTDFNTITTGDFDNIAIRPGGGSVIYGSSAIGGSVHLNSLLRFGKHFGVDATAQYGSFNTLGFHAKVSSGSEKSAFQISVSRNSSDNNFELTSGRKNTNGDYYNISYNLAFGYRINDKNRLKFYSYAFDGERHFSLISPSETKTKYRDFNTRNLVEWTAEVGKFTSNAKAGFITEHYTYFETFDTDSPAFGKAQTAIVKYDASYEFTPKIVLNAVTDFTHTSGNGSDVSRHERKIGSIAVLFKHEIFEKFRYEIGLRKEATGNYDSPMLFSAGMAVRFNEFYTLKWNGSHNFRIPTFNDVYWSEGGNPDLKPESSYQTEIGNEFTIQNFKLTVTGFLANIGDMIQWLPGTTTIWNPVNVNRVRTYGIESALTWDKKIGEHQFSLSGTYSYTVSKNQLTGYQLIYVPYHKLTSALAWSWKKISADYQFLFNGEVFTRSDNNPRYNIDAFWVSNVSAGYSFGKSDKLKVGARILNLFDHEYQVVEGRFFPGRNFNMYLNLKF